MSVPSRSIDARVRSRRTGRPNATRSGEPMGELGSIRKIIGYAGNTYRFFPFGSPFPPISPYGCVRSGRRSDQRRPKGASRSNGQVVVQVMRTGRGSKRVSPPRRVVRSTLMSTRMSMTARRAPAAGTSQRLASRGWRGRAGPGRWVTWATFSPAAPVCEVGPLR